MARGRATIATVSPAMLSRRSRSNVYPSPRTVTSFGVNAVSRASYGFIFGLRFASLIVEHRWHALRLTSRCGIIQPDPAPGAVAGRILTDDLDSGRFQCVVHLNRSEDRRVGQECVSTFISRWSPYHLKIKTLPKDN